MKKRFLYLIVSILALGSLGFTLVRYTAKSNHPVSYYLKDRKGASAGTTEWMDARKKAVALQNKIMTQPKNEGAKLALAALFIQESRITGDHDYYDAAAMKYVDEVLQLNDRNFEAILYKALVLLSQHRFQEAIEVGERGKELNPYNAFIYGILVDGNIEMGNYEAAVGYSDKMVSIRPDMRSYARISYLREIHGDYPGAIEAMKLAIGAGIPGDESSEWSRVQLGKLYEHTGQLKDAEFQYKIASEQRPQYAYALAGLARIAVAEKNYARAISLIKQANEQVSDYGFSLFLSGIYDLKGDKELANKTRYEVILKMRHDAELESRNPNGNHHADQELAEAYLLQGDFRDALQHALVEYTRRSSNIEVNELLAWIYYRKQDYPKALQHIEVALKTGSKNPSLLCKVGLIYFKSGQSSLGRKYLQQGLAVNPILPMDVCASVRDAGY